jgi:iron only hydrogenase large subunit-like protein
VKAIQVVNDSARVMSERCIYCGTCVNVCPVGAKKVRDDLSRAKLLLKRKAKVVVSLAPSFTTEFPGLEPGRLIRSLKALGFWGVSETALGAEHVSAACAAVLKVGPPGAYISTACPSVVEMVRKYYPDLVPDLLRLVSPLQAHCALLRETYGEEVGIVFIGPCISKKLESDAAPDRLHVALTFRELQRWFEDRGIDPESETPLPEDVFVPRLAAEGALYPMDGGMNHGISARLDDPSVRYMALSGVANLQHSMEGLKEASVGKRLFLELLACEGGCVNGPRASRRTGTAAKRCQVFRYGQKPPLDLPRHSELDIRSAFAVMPPPPLKYPDAQIREALRLVGKISRDDELNCGGCGYDSCREFAEALIQLKAERAMCVTYMRKLALKKANALIQKMPSAVVIVNDTMRIIECNTAFAKLFGKPEPASADSPPQLENLMLSEVMPFANLFHSMLKSGENILDRDLRYQQIILHATIFTIEKHCVVGGILQDITQPVVRKAEVIRKAQEVIQRSLATTQQIACLLGENAAESEITLNSIIESFSPAKPEEPKGDHDWRRLYRH